MTAINRFLRFLWFGVYIRTVVFLLLGINLRNRERLPREGPAILAANHNSHLDTMVMMSLYPMRMLPRLRPVAAADYFMGNWFMRWFSLNILGIIPIDRRARERGEDPFVECAQALERGDILILFPEGSRGEPEKMTTLKKGVAHLVEQNANVPVYPVYLHGLGKALPKGEGLLVPFHCDAFVDTPISWTGDRDSFLELLAQRFQTLAGRADVVRWE